MPLDLSEIALDSDLGEAFCIIRTAGYFGLGGWIAKAPQSIPAFGIIAIASDQALRQAPEGDRVDGALQLILAQPIFETLAKNSATSDKIQWLGNMYRVQSVGPWKMNGFWSAILVRMTGE